MIWEGTQRSSSKALTDHSTTDTYNPAGDLLRVLRINPLNGKPMNSKVSRLFELFQKQFWVRNTIEILANGTDRPCHQMNSLPLTKNPPLFYKTPQIQEK